MFGSGCVVEEGSVCSRAWQQKAADMRGPNSVNINIGELG
jgi:hypothetical protein